MRKIRLTESELIRLVQQIVSEQPTNYNPNPIPGINYPNLPPSNVIRKDIEKTASLHQRQPSSLTLLQPGQTITLGLNVFETGKSFINKNSQEFKNAIGALVNLPQGTTIKVTGGASAVGSSRGYDNKALALRRANNMIAALKGTGKVNQLTFVPEGVVGKNTQYNSPGAKAEQFVKLTREQKTNVAISRPAIDNTHYGNPNRTYQDVLKYPGYALPSDNPNKGTLKGVRDPNYFKPKINEDKIKEVVKQNLLEFLDSQEFSGRAGFSRGTPLTFGEKLKRAAEKCFGKIGSESSLPDGTPLSDSRFCKKIRELRSDIALAGMFIDDI